MLRIFNFEVILHGRDIPSEARLRVFNLEVLSHDGDVHIYYQFRRIKPFAKSSYQLNSRVEVTSALLPIPSSQTSC